MPPDNSGQTRAECAFAEARRVTRGEQATDMRELSKRALDWLCAYEDALTTSEKERDEARAALEAERKANAASRNTVVVLRERLAALREERTRYFTALDTIASWHENDLRFTLSDALRIAKKAIE